MKSWYSLTICSGSSLSDDASGCAAGMSASWTSWPKVWAFRLTRRITFSSTAMLVSRAIMPVSSPASMSLVYLRMRPRTAGSTHQHAARRGCALLTLPAAI
eukprot:scaffold2900_cov30-Tisochrysis_lutea.AAC.2